MELLFRNTESRVAEVNALTPDELTTQLRHCLDVTRWVHAVRDARPFGDHPALWEAVMNAAAPFTVDEIAGALRHHPRIGERPLGHDAHAVSARAEQSGVDTSADGIRDRLVDGNRAYETRFGHVFLIRAASRTADEVLRELSQRLQNDENTERAVVEHELRDIAAVRLLGSPR